MALCNSCKPTHIVRYVQGCNRKLYCTFVLSYCTYKKESYVLLTLIVLYVQQKKTVCQTVSQQNMSSYVRLIAIQSDLHCYVCTSFYFSEEFVAFLIPPSFPHGSQWTPWFAEIVIFFSVSPWHVISWPCRSGLWTTTTYPSIRIVAIRISRYLSVDISWCSLVLKPHWLQRNVL